MAGRIIDSVGISSDLVDNFIDHIDLDAVFIYTLSGKSVDFTISQSLLRDISEVSRSESGIGEVALLDAIINDRVKTKLEKSVDVLILGELFIRNLNKTITDSGVGRISHSGVLALFCGTSLGGDNAGGADGRGRVVDVEGVSPEGVAFSG